jgi:hypothetical protein
MLGKPWNYGKTDRIVKDLVEIADVTTELQKQKVATVRPACDAKAPEIPTIIDPVALG